MFAKKKKNYFHWKLCIKFELFYLQPDDYNEAQQSEDGDSARPWSSQNAESTEGGESNTGADSNGDKDKDEDLDELFSELNPDDGLEF